MFLFIFRIFINNMVYYIRHIIFYERKVHRKEIRNGELIMYRKLLLVLCTSCILMSGCSTKHRNIETKTPSTTQADLTKLATGNVQIMERVTQASWEVTTPKELPFYDRENEGNLGWDLRHVDLSNINLIETGSLLESTFDTSTVWPDEMPQYFVPTTILEAGKNPGLGIRSLHAQGITGKGIGIAIIDEAPLLTHESYKDQIKLYETLNSYDEESTFHGTAVTSLVAGQQNGVAPDANIYYIASKFADYDIQTGSYKINLNYMVDAIERVLEINKSLPQNQKIRVLMIAREYNNYNGEDEKRVDEIIAKADKEGIFVVTPSLVKQYGFTLTGLSRIANMSPETLANYRLGSWENTLYLPEKSIYVPKDNRTVADYTSTTGYTYVPVGGDGFATAWLTGIYALSAQVFPNLTGERFLRYVVDYNDVLNVKEEGSNYTLKSVVSPQDLINGLKSAAGN